MGCVILLYVIVGRSYLANSKINLGCAICLESHQYFFGSAFDAADDCNFSLMVAIILGR
jgi:hypothetical protein